MEMTMTNLTRFDPFRSLVGFDPVWNFDDLFYMPRMPVFRAPGEPEVKLDLSEDDRAFYVNAEMPGVRKEDIHVAIDGEKVSIRAETKKEMEERKGTTVLRSERYYGRWNRTFTLAKAVDESKVDAKYADGVLMLTLPKKAGVAVKEVAIH
jgi:HSP20 family protein